MLFARLLVFALAYNESIHLVHSKAADFAELNTSLDLSSLAEQGHAVEPVDELLIAQQEGHTRRRRRRHQTTNHKPSSHFANADTFSSVKIASTRMFHGKVKGTIYGISSTVSIPGKPRHILVLCDRGYLIIMKLSVTIATKQLTSVVPIRRWRIYGAEAPLEKIKLDLEGVDILPNGNIILTQDTPPMIRILDRKIHQLFRTSRHVLYARKGRSVSRHFRDNVKHNKGLEGIVLVGDAVITGTEDNMLQDSKTVLRLFESHKGEPSNAIREYFLSRPTEERQPSLQLVGLARTSPNQSQGLNDGGRFFALFRGYTPQLGAQNRLVELDSAGARPVNQCHSINTTGVGPCSARALKPVSVSKPLLKWSKLHGHPDSVRIANYEGLGLLPAQLFGANTYEELGGVMLLMVSDNNQNPAIDTEFVLMRVPFVKH